MQIQELNSANIHRNNRAERQLGSRKKQARIFDVQKPGPGFVFLY